MSSNRMDSVETETKIVIQNEQQEFRWIARKVRPVTVLYVWLILFAFMLVSYFVFHSTDAVKALAVAALAVTIAMIPAVLGKVEYRATGSGVDKRPHKTDSTIKFDEVFRWDDLNYVTPQMHGFKYFKRLDEKNPVRLFWKRHLSEQFSGEVHVEVKDKARVYDLFADRGISIQKR